LPVYGASVNNTFTSLVRSSVALALLVLGAVSAQAADCVPNLRILTSVPMQSTADRTVMVVPVTVDSSNRKFLLDTGGRVSQLSKATVQALDLPQRVTEEQRLIDLAGNISDTKTTVRRLIVGAREQRGVSLGVAANPELGTSLPYDGLLSTDLFVDADLDMDFGARRLTAFSTDHCDGRVVYWPANNVAIVPISVRQNLITFPVTVDGHTVTAVMDTGAQFTIMNMKLANRLFGLTPASPDMKPLTETSGEWTLTSYGHQFDELDFEGVQVKNLRIYLMPDQMTSHDPLRHRELGDPLGLRLHREIDSNVTVPDVILGMDVLRHLHVYFATKEKRLYISDAVSGESALFGLKY
jgi:predicted aspartyl protease